MLYWRNIIILCTICIISLSANSISKHKNYPTSDYPYPTSKEYTTWKPYPTTSWNPWPTTNTGPYPTSNYPPYSSTWWPWPTTTKRPPYSSTWFPWSTTTSRRPWSTDTTKKPETEHCYGHFIYKEEHNIIVDGEDDRHKNPEECEFACTMITECRFWKYTMNGDHKGYCELNRGTPLNHGEVVGQRNVKLVNTGKGPYCYFQPHNHPHHVGDP